MQPQFQQGSPEWREWRRKKIGASDSPIIMGVSPFRTPLQLWEDKMNLTQTVETERMRRGKHLEEEACKCFEKKTDLLVLRPNDQDGLVRIHNKFNWMIASYDGIDIHGKFILEIKCPGSEDHEKAKSGHVPEKYFPQIQHQLEVAQLDIAYYFSYDGQDGVIVQVNRDNSYIQRMVVKEFEFWECMESWTPPELTERDYKYKNDLLWNRASEDYLKAKEGREHFEKKEKEARELLICMCEGQSSKGNGLSVSKIIRKGCVNYSNIPELEKVDLDKYRSAPIISWRISNNHSD